MKNINKKFVTNSGKKRENRHAYNSRKAENKIRYDRDEREYRKYGIRFYEGGDEYEK